MIAVLELSEDEADSVAEQATFTVAVVDTEV